MHKKPLAFKITPTYKIWDIWEILKPNIKIVAPISIINVNGFDFFWNSPRSCLRLLRLLQILTVQTDKTMATMKNKTPPRKKEKKQNSISKNGLDIWSVILAILFLRSYLQGYLLFITYQSGCNRFLFNIVRQIIF